MMRRRRKDQALSHALAMGGIKLVRPPANHFPTEDSMAHSINWFEIPMVGLS
jgi:hypothetical protein